MVPGGVGLTAAKVRTAGILPGVQYLRFVAAALVVATHAWQMVPYVGTGDLGSSFVGGQAGVDIFFVISGFIMVHISGQGASAQPGSFLFDRLTRIAPPYWIVTLVMAAVIAVAPSLFKSAQLDVAGLASSLLFFPWPNPNDKLGTMPLLAIGWTLNYEMLFYATFTIAMLINHRLRILLCLIQIGLLVLAGIVLPFAGNAWFDFFTNSLMLEFIFGMIVALVAPRIRLPGWLIGVLLAAAIAWFGWAIMQPVGRLDAMRWLIYGLPAAAIVLLVVSADLQGRVKNLRWLVLLGNASYALYLVHLFVLGAIRAAWPRLPTLLHQSDLALLFTAFMASIAASIMFHLWVEKPSVALVRRQLIGVVKRTTA